MGEKIRRSESECGWLRGKRIGEGCFGTVSLAVHRSDGRVFAVKSVDRATCLPSQLEALEREIRILRSLSSPYVVRYLGDDDTREGASSYRNLHVEYFPGGTVSDAAARDETTLRSLAWCLVSALRHVHSRGFVHCDVKGRNVLVGPGEGRATLADFGSASEPSPVAVMRGSALWMAPEVVRGEGQGTESDVWSLGCTVIEMIAGRPAWEDRGAETLKMIGFSDELPEIPAGLSETGRDFVEKCLRRDPARRWSCDRLLRHPFLAGAAPAEPEAPGPSPRCVFDFDFDNSDSDDDDYDRTDESSAKERIGKLAAIGGANWESDGWTVVRKSGGVANSEYLEFPRAESEYSEFGGYSCCRDGLRKPYNYCLLLVVWLYLLYSLYINIGTVLFSYSSSLFLLLLRLKFNKLITSYILANITRDDVSDRLPIFSYLLCFSF